MTTVRKKAMEHHLKDTQKVGKKPKRPSESLRPPSVVSIESGLSSESQEIATIPSTNSAIASSRAMSVSNLGTSSSSVSGPSSTSYVLSRRRSPDSPAERLFPPGPIVAAPGPGPLPYDQHPPPLFVSIGTAIDPFKTMFQSSHPHVSVEQLKGKCSEYFGTKGLGIYWIPLALSHAHTFLGTLCLATAYNDVISGLDGTSLATIALRQEVIHYVSGNMTDPRKNLADHNFMAVIQLIISEIIGREGSSLQYHEMGMVAMIENRGGLERLGLEGRLASSITWVSMASSILREDIPRTVYVDYCLLHSRKDYANTATVPESPLYRPQCRSSFNTLEKSPDCSPQARDLISNMWDMIERFLDDAKQTRRNSESLDNIHRRITNFLPISRHGTRQKKDWRYEVIRITATILSTAIINRVPLSRVSVSGLMYPPPLYTSMGASMSSESLVSPRDPRRISASEYTLSPYAVNTTSLPFQNSPNWYHSSMTHRPSDSSMSIHRPSFSSGSRNPSDSTSFALPSISSTTSTSSDNYFPDQTAQYYSDTNSLLEELKEAIERSNLSQCWSDKSNVSQCWSEMAGVLLWIGLVAGAATKDSKNRKLARYFSAITMRSGIVLCFEHPEAINATVYRMSQVNQKLRQGQESSRKTSGTKRQKI